MVKVQNFGALPLLVALGIAVLTVLFPGSSAFARYASMVVDAGTGEVLHEVNADVRRYPASLTKIMTLYLTFEALERGRLRLDERMPVSYHAAHQPPSRLGLHPGDSLLVEDASLALVTKSANDAAAVVAERLGGTEEGFAEIMTAKARALGMHDTEFRNASGLPNPEQVTTARDMATLARAVLRDYPDYYPYFSTGSFQYQGRNHPNHNRLLGAYPGLDGIKTGYINASGFNLVASAKRDGKRLIGVVFGAHSPGERGRLMAALLDRGFGDDSPTMLAEVDQRERLATRVSADDAGESVSGGTWGVQVGTFGKQAQALNAARAAQRKAPSALGDGSINVVKVTGKKRRTVYAARVVGVGQSDAGQACRVLKKGKSPCTVVKSRSHDVRLASATATATATATVLSSVEAKAPAAKAANSRISNAQATKAQTARSKAVATPQKSTASRKPSSKTKSTAAAAAPVIGDTRPWSVRIGPYADESAAYAGARKAMKIAPSALEDGRVKVVPVASKSRAPQYRAHIIGIERAQADLACQRLQAKEIGCTALKM
jgi:D-alanyl-D-alanine carboxypeptidase